MSNEQQTEIKTLKFGLQPPPEAKAAWGARAIYHPESKNPIDIVWNRTDDFGTEEDLATILKAFGDWRIKDHQYEFGDANENYELTHTLPNNVIVKTDPRKSYGYLYIVAYIV